MIQSTLPFILLALILLVVILGMFGVIRVLLQRVTVLTNMVNRSAESMNATTQHSLAQMRETRDQRDAGYQRSVQAMAETMMQTTMQSLKEISAQQALSGLELAKVAWAPMIGSSAAQAERDGAPGSGRNAGGGGRNAGEQLTPIYATEGADDDRDPTDGLEPAWNGMVKEGAVMMSDWEDEQGNGEPFAHLGLGSPDLTQMFGPMKR